MSASRLSESAPAKVNLALHVTGRRSDGYHDLDSLVVFAEVGDVIEARLSDRDTLHVSGPFAPMLHGGEANLVTRAIRAFRERFPDHVAPGLAIELQKNLPVAAGLGGGSADAAAVLRLMAALGETDIGVRELIALALSLGADVPACLLSVNCVLKGIGEVVCPLPAFPACHLVLMNPMIPLITADVFRRLRKHDFAPLPPLPSPMTRPAQLAMWLEETRNDLEEPAIELVPAIGEMIRSLQQTQGCLIARMSGSGATVFGLYGAASLAHEAAHQMRQTFPDYWVAAAPVLTEA